MPGQNRLAAPKAGEALNLHQRRPQFAGGDARQAKIDLAEFRMRGFAWDIESLGYRPEAARY